MYIGPKVLYIKKAVFTDSNFTWWQKFAWLSYQSRKLGTKVKSPTLNQ